MQEPSERVRQVLQRFARGGYAYREMEEIPVDATATVLALLGGLACPEWRGVMACAEALGRATVAQDEAVAGLVGLLGHAKDLVVQEAVEALGKLGPAAQSAVPHLLPLLLLPQEEHPFTGREAITALGAIGGPMRERIVSELAALVACALECQSDRRALHAFQTARLGKPPGQLPSIPDYLGENQFEDGYDLIRATLDALTALREPAAMVVPALRAAARIPSANVRACALRCLLSLETGVGHGVTTALELLHQDPPLPSGWSANPGPLRASTALDLLFGAGRELDRIVLGLLDLTLPKVSWHDPAPGLSRFVASEGFTAHAQLAQGTGDPRPAVRAHAARLLGYLGARGKPFAGRLLALLDDRDGSVCEAAVDSLAQLGCRAPEVLQQLAACGERHRGTRLGDRVTEVLRGMGASTQALDGVDLAAACVTYFELPALLCGHEARIADGAVLMPWKCILKPGEEDAWETDEDEVGMMCLLPGGTPSLAMATLPLRLPIQPTGAAGAKRKFELRAVTESGLLCSLDVPFSDPRGWGDDNYAYMFDPATRGWSRVSPAEQPPGYRLTALPEPAIAENPDNALCGGELVVYAAPGNGGLAFACDATPYHLDDWVRTEEIAAILRAQGALLARERAGACEVCAETPQRWEVRCGGAGEPIVLRFVRQFVLERDTRQKAASVSVVEPITATLVGSRLVLCLRIRRRDGTAADAAAVVEV